MCLGKKIAEETRGKVRGSEFKGQVRKKAEYFTRSRTMTFEELVIFMLFSFKSSTQSALRRFFASIGKNVFMAQQPLQILSEARKKIKVCAFTELFKLTVKIMTEGCLKKWHHYRVYAIDGSKIALPADKKLAEYFGAMGKNNSAPTAQGPILYGVLNDIVAVAAIEPLSTGGRTLAERHISVCAKLPTADKKLILFDRGCPSSSLIEKLESLEIYYIMRVKSKFNKEIDMQTAPNGCACLEQGGKLIRVRVIKFKLPSGETETLITDIIDLRLGKNAFKNLYFMRWPVEGKYGVIKNKLQLENFSSRAVEGVHQDFFTAMYLTNIAAAVAM